MANKFGLQLGTVEQLIRMAGLIIGSTLFGSDVANGAEYQAVIGAVITVASFAWWAVRERQVKN